MESVPTSHMPKALCMAVPGAAAAPKAFSSPRGNLGPPISSECEKGWGEWAHAARSIQKPTKRCKADATLAAKSMTRSGLEAMFGLSLSRAATAMGVGRTLFKKVCRRNGIAHWPSFDASGCQLVIQRPSASSSSNSKFTSSPSDCPSTVGAATVHVQPGTYQKRSKPSREASTGMQSAIGRVVLPLINGHILKAMPAAAANATSLTFRPVGLKEERGWQPAAGFQQELAGGWDHSTSAEGAALAGLLGLVAANNSSAATDRSHILPRMRKMLNAAPERPSQRPVLGDSVDRPVSAVWWCSDTFATIQQVYPAPVGVL